jgi:hypothetical protein
MFSLLIESSKRMFKEIFLPIESLILYDVSYRSERWTGRGQFTEYPNKGRSAVRTVYKVVRIECPCIIVIQIQSLPCASLVEDQTFLYCAKGIVA